MSISYVDQHYGDDTDSLLTSMEDDDSEMSLADDTDVADSFSGILTFNDNDREDVVNREEITVSSISNETQGMY